MHPPEQPPQVGIFDSGVGGLSVLRALLAQQPSLRACYIADSAHAPYGERDASHVLERSVRLADELVRRGANVIVVACNTATALAIDPLRQRHPGVAWVGVEPGIKPAASISSNRRIAVMATAATLSSERFATLVARHGQGCEVVPVACHGLAAAIERGNSAETEIDLLLDRYGAMVKQSAADTLVLGCTHYPFVADRIALRLATGVHLLDTADAVARHALRQLREAGPFIVETPPAGQLQLLSTGELAVLERLAAIHLKTGIAARRVEI